MLASRPIQNDSVHPGRLNPRIGSANPRLYESIRDAKDWANPYLVIGQDGIEVISKNLPSGRMTVASTDLQRTLIELPLFAWPYGRVVAVQDTGVHEADGNDEQEVINNRNATLAILKTLDVVVERWPSA